MGFDRMRSTASEILASVRISDVTRAITGGDLQRAGTGRWRARATWRDGDGWSVSLDDGRGLWFDHATGEGGGVLDLVVRVRGGSRQDALRWVAERAGIPMDPAPLSIAQRACWAAERRHLERELPRARLWQQAAVQLAEELLYELKRGLTDRTAPLRPEIGELRDVTSLLDHLRRIDGQELVTEYSTWRVDYPGWTSAMVRAAASRERAGRALVLSFLRGTAA